LPGALRAVLQVVRTDLLANAIATLETLATRFSSENNPAVFE
jgi:hypothetical protein